MKNFCLIGSNVEGISYSKVLHDSFSLYDYELKNVSEKELEDFVKSSSFDGFNVTVPHKKSVMRYLDEIDETALKIGSVNTVVKSGGKSFGYNTDIYGMERCFEINNATVKNKDCLVLGSGGTSNTAIYYCKKFGAKSISIASRMPKNIAIEGVRVLSYNDIYRENFDVIINTTPVGMAPNVDVSPIDISRMKAPEILFDAIYNPKCTSLVKNAKRLGINAFGGLDMLIYQGIAAAKLFVGKELSDPLYDKALQAIEDYIDKA